MKDQGEEDIDARLNVRLLLTDILCMNGVYIYFFLLRERERESLKMIIEWNLKLQQQLQKGDYNLETEALERPGPVS